MYFCKHVLKVNFHFIILVTFVIVDVDVVSHINECNTIRAQGPRITFSESQGLKSNF